jgi:hypothetical protein
MNAQSCGFRPGGPSDWYSPMVRQYHYQPCIPTRGTEVPAGRIGFTLKQDGYED